MESTNISNQKGVKQRQFSTAMRPLLIINRFVGLSPIFFAKKLSGEMQIALSPTAEKYTWRLIIVAYICEFLVTRWSLSLKYIPDIVLQFDWYCRMVLSIITHLCCWFNRDLAVRSLLAADDFGVEVPQHWKIKFIWFPMFLSCGIATLLFLAQTTFFPIYKSYLALLKAIVVTIMDLIPALVNILVCSVFTCQVSALRYAIAHFNNDIDDFVKKRLEPFPFRIMLRRHRKFRVVCSKLNCVYGICMLSGIFGVFCDTTYCIVYSLLTTDAISRASNLSAFIWGLLIMVPSFIAMDQCQRMENEVNRIYLITSGSKGFQLDETYRSQLEAHEWIIQLRQLPIKFTAWGFFDLNGGQVKTIMFTIISYAVILLQNSYHVDVL